MSSMIFIVDQFGDALDQPGLVHLVRNLGDDDGLSSLVMFSMAALARIMKRPRPVL